MGQIFYSCVYDIETKTCCVYDADKFHANCYAHSRNVFSAHYLLRQKPYNVMWGGYDVVLDDSLKDFSREQDLFGFSTYLDYTSFEENYCKGFNDKSGNENLENESYYQDIKFIDENSKLWKNINVSAEAKDFFDWEKNKSVKYDGYLINLTKKQAVDLVKHYECSKTLNSYMQEIVIDPVPVLTETGGGTMMALLNGASIETTEELAGIWCGDLLQIVAELPKGYEIVNTCFADICGRARYYIEKFGFDENGYVLKNKKNERYQGVTHNIIQERGSPRCVKLTKDEKGNQMLCAEIIAP